jgi:hypothetical protein
VTQALETFMPLSFPYENFSDIHRFEEKEKKFTEKS